MRPKPCLGQEETGVQGLEGQLLTDSEEPIQDVGARPVAQESVVGRGSQAQRLTEGGG